MSLQLTLRVRDERLQSFIKRVPEIFGEALEEWKDTGATTTMEWMRFEAPYRTGFLVESIDYHFTPKGFSVYPTASYAKFVEKGTRAHEIKPVAAEALRWFGAFGEPIFATRVWHPGTAPNPFVERTRENMRPHLRDLAEEIFKRRFMVGHA